MQATLALLGFSAGDVGLAHHGKAAFLDGALLLFANWPWTLFGMLPITSDSWPLRVEDVGPVTRSMLQKWNYLHGCTHAAGFLVGIGLLVWNHMQISWMLSAKDFDYLAI